MIEFSLSIDLGKKERVAVQTERMPVDRDFVIRSLTAIATELAGRTSSRGTIFDESGAKVGGWQFALTERSGD